VADVCDPGSLEEPQVHVAQFNSTSKAIAQKVARLHQMSIQVSNSQETPPRELRDSEGTYGVSWSGIECEAGFCSWQRPSLSKYYFQKICDYFAKATNEHQRKNRYACTLD